MCPTSAASCDTVAIADLNSGDRSVNAETVPEGFRADIYGVGEVPEVTGTATYVRLWPKADLNLMPFSLI